MTTFNDSGQEKPDRRRTPRGGAVNFFLREIGFEPDFEQVTAVSTIAFTADGKIIAAEEHRGPDLPGGHVQEGETTAEQTARREAQEETGVELAEVSFLRAIESDLYAPEASYMVIMTALVKAEGVVPPGMRKHVMTVAEFKQQHRGLRKEMICELVDQAYAFHFPAGA